MSVLLCDYRNPVSESTAQYRNRVDFLSICLETSEGSSVWLRGGPLETLSEELAVSSQVPTCHRGSWRADDFF